MVTRSVRALPLSLALLAACGGGGTDSKVESLDGDYVLLNVDAANLPAIVTSDRAIVSETLLSARFEIRGTAVLDIKQRRKSNSPAIVTDTLNLVLSRVSDSMILTRPADAPTAQPDTATLADGLVPNALLTLRTRSAPSSYSAERMTLVYTLQK